MIELSVWHFGLICAGLFMVGAFVGLIVMALMVAAGESDRQTEELYQSQLKEQGLL